jgi:hypothetical protein
VLTAFEEKLNYQEMFFHVRKRWKWTAQPARGPLSGFGSTCVNRLAEMLRRRPRAVFLAFPIDASTAPISAPIAGDPGCDHEGPQLERVFPRAYLVHIHPK